MRHEIRSVVIPDKSHPTEYYEFSVPDNSPESLAKSLKELAEIITMDATYFKDELPDL